MFFDDDSLGEGTTELQILLASFGGWDVNVKSVQEEASAKV